MEPDEEWEKALRTRIEQELHHMFADADYQRDIELAKAPLNRKIIEQDHDDAYACIETLMMEQYYSLRTEERNYRRWLAGIPVDPEWEKIFKKERQNHTVENNDKGGKRSSHIGFKVLKEDERGEEKVGVLDEEREEERHKNGRRDGGIWALEGSNSASAERQVEEERQKKIDDPKSTELKAKPNASDLEKNENEVKKRCEALKLKEDEFQKKQSIFEAERTATRHQVAKAKEELGKLKEEAIRILQEARDKEARLKEIEHEMKRNEKIEEREAAVSRREADLKARELEMAKKFDAVRQQLNDIAKFIPMPDQQREETKQGFPPGSSRQDLHVEEADDYNRWMTLIQRQSIQSILSFSTISSIESTSTVEPKSQWEVYQEALKQEESIYSISEENSAVSEGSITGSDSTASTNSTSPSTVVPKLHLWIPSTLQGVRPFHKS